MILNVLYKVLKLILNFSLSIYIFLQTKFVALNEKIPTATFSQDLTLTDDTKRFVIETANPAV